MEAVFFTNRGLQRYQNEDALLIGNKVYSDVDFLLPQSLQFLSDEKFIVADGLGGHRKGNIASFLVLDYLKSQQVTNEKDLQHYLLNAKLVLNQYVKSHPQAYQLGTVLSGIVVLSNKLIVFNIGDARVYQIENKILKRITRDHSYVELLYQRGQIRYEDMRTHPRKNIVTSCLLGDEKETISEIFIKTIPRNLNSTYQFLICSDGLWEMLSDKEIQNLIWTSKSTLELANCLKIEAFEKGAFDNISYIILTI